MTKINKILNNFYYGVFLAFTAGVTIDMASMLSRDPVSPPKYYQEISPQEIVDYDGFNVELDMTPVYFGKDQGFVGLRNEGISLVVNPSDIDPNGPIFKRRRGRSWDASVKNAAFDSIESLVSSEDPRTITVRGILDGNTLDAHSINTMDGDYSITDKFIGDGQ